jgi:TonB family protein
MFTMQWRTAIALSLFSHLAFFILIAIMAGNVSRHMEYIPVELIEPSGGLTPARMRADQPRNARPGGEQKTPPKTKQEPPVDNAMGMKEKVVEAPQAPAEQTQPGYPSYGNSSSASTLAGQGVYQPFHTLSRTPYFKTKVKPVYPASERAAGVEARVMVEVYINERGGVDDVKLVKSGGVLFDQCVVEAVRVSSFEPGYINGEPVRARVQIPYVFKLR